MKIRRTQGTRANLDLQMTPMIDIVFQLLVFFVMTFKIVSLEGDFNVKMPRVAADPTLPPNSPPLRLTLTADDQGELVSLTIGQRRFTGGAAFTELRGFMIDQFANPAAPSGAASGAEVQLACDEHLRYHWVVDTMDAISGYPAENGDIIQLVEKISFAAAP